MKPNNNHLRAPTWADFGGFPSQFKPKKAKKARIAKKKGWIERLFRR